MENKQSQVFNIIKQDEQSKKNINPYMNDIPKKTIKFKTTKTECQNIPPKNDNNFMDLEENINQNEEKNNNKIIEEKSDVFTFDPNKKIIKENYPSFSNNKEGKYILIYNKINKFSKRNE